jgi:hypothetical protein
MNIEGGHSAAFARYYFVILFGLSRMGAAVVTGHASHGRDHIALIVLVHLEIFFVDLVGHGEHMAGYILFRFCVAGKVEVMRGAIGGRCVAEVASDAQGIFPGVHNLAEFFVADVFWEDFEISFRRLVVGGAHGGYADGRQDEEGGNDCEFFVMQHIADFGPTKLGI